MREKEIARQMVEALEAGQYTAPDGSIVDIRPFMQTCLAGTHTYEPETLTGFRNEVLATAVHANPTHFEIANETTLHGCARIIAAYPNQRVGVLNFASARHPGGGFLSGAKAQEESLARSSGLYRSLLKYPDYYVYHRSHKTGLYSDRMIYSPDCPVMRDDDGNWLPQPYTVDFITSAAPNAGAMQLNEVNDLGQIPTVFRERASKVLGLAAHYGCEILILGAWGCGAFKNDPQLVARIFWDLLNPRGPFRNRFDRVVFSILDTRGEQRNIHAFQNRFASVLTESEP